MYNKNITDYCILNKSLFLCWVVVVCGGDFDGCFGCGWDWG